MKRSEIHAALGEAPSAFAGAGWVLPPGPRWDVTDFGWGEFPRVGRVLVNLSEEPESCEKLRFAREKEVTSMPGHGEKKEDIICRHGRCAPELWADHPGKCAEKTLFSLSRNGSLFGVRSGAVIPLNAGERITLVPAGVSRILAGGRRRWHRRGLDGKRRSEWQLFCRSTRHARNRDGMA